MPSISRKYKAHTEHGPNCMFHWGPMMERSMHTDIVWVCSFLCLFGPLRDCRFGLRVGLVFRRASPVQNSACMHQKAPCRHQNCACRHCHWFLGFLVSQFCVSRLWFLSFKASQFQSCLVSKFQRFTNVPCHSFWKILIPYPTSSRIYYTCRGNFRRLSFPPF